MTDNIVPFFENLKQAEKSYLIMLLNKWKTAGQEITEPLLPFVNRGSCVAALQMEGQKQDCFGKNHLVNKLLKKFTALEFNDGNTLSFDMFLSLEKVRKEFNKASLSITDVLRIALPHKIEVECGLQYNHFGNEYKKVPTMVYSYAQIKHIRGNLFQCSIPNRSVEQIKEYIHERFGM